MTKCVRHTAFGLVATLLTATVAPLTAHAGNVTIYNENCTHLKGLKRKKFVTVYVDASEAHGCTDTKVQVKKGHSKTIELVARNKNGITCKYNHNAEGVVGGKYDIKAEEFSSVTCKRDRARVCQCKKD